jgi:hypothetical protein
MAVINQNVRTANQACVADVTILAGADPSATIIAAKTNYTIYITHISLLTTTDNAATQTLKDTASTPVVVAASKASPGIGVTLWVDFGEDGTPLTADKGLALAASGAGLAGRLHVEGYYKQTANISL